MEVNEQTPQAWLQSEFCTRRKKNPSYSLRRMAQQLDIPSGRLSEILNGRRRLTVSMAQKIAERFSYPPEKRHRFLQTVAQQAPQPAASDSAESDYQQLSTDAFNVLADWYHFAILSLIDLDDFDPAPSAIAARLGVSATEARSSLDRLARLGLIETTGGRIVKTSKNISASHELASSALRLSHKQNLELASMAIDETPRELRDITSITMAIDETKLPQAKEMIKKFRRQLCRFLEADTKNQVYNLNIQLFPLTKKRGRP